MYVVMVILILLMKIRMTIALKNMGTTKKKSDSVAQYVTSGFTRSVFTYEIYDF